jgi:hypothetical protein
MVSGVRSTDRINAVTGFSLQHSFSGSLSLMTPDRLPTYLMEESMSLANVIHGIASDRSFASRFTHDPTTALASVDLALNEEEVSAIRATIRRPGWHELCSFAKAEIDNYPWIPVEVASPVSCSII